MKRNWIGGIFRIVIVLSFVAAIGYEVATMEDPLKLWLSWDNGLVFAFKIVLIPAAFIYLLWWTVNWCRKGFTEPKLNLNWEEGGNRLAVFLLGLLILGIFIWFWVETKNLVSAILILSLLVAPCIIIGGGLYWIDKGLNKSRDNE